MISGDFSLSVKNINMEKLQIEGDKKEDCQGNTKSFDQTMRGPAGRLGSFSRE